MLQPGLPESSQAEGQVAFAPGAGLCRLRCWLCEPNWVLLGCSNLPPTVPHALSLLWHLPGAPTCSQSPHPTWRGVVFLFSFPQTHMGAVTGGTMSSQSSGQLLLFLIFLFLLLSKGLRESCPHPHHSFSSSSHSCSSSLPTAAKRGWGSLAPMPITPPRFSLLSGSTSLVLTQDNLA